MLKTVALAVLLAAAAILGFAATRPDSFRVERSVVIAAPADRIYPLLADFRRFGEWSPWEHRDPRMKRHFSGAPQGEGAVYAWEGNDDVGEGRMEIVQATSPSMVSMRLDFVRPVEARHGADFTLVPQGDATQVTWAMHGDNPYLSKLMQVFVSMDRIVGGDFEAGLAKLKQVAEQPPSAGTYKP